MPRTLAIRRRAFRRLLQLESLEQRLPLVNDLDDALAEATPLGAITTTPKSATAAISPADDVDMYGFTVSAGQTIDFDIDTTANGPGGLGSFLRLFNAQGQQLAANNDAAAPGENTIGFDAYLRFTFTTAGGYFIGVSNANNSTYDPVSGNGDVATGQNATGNYQLFVQALPVDPNDTLTQATNLGAITGTPKTVDTSIVTDIDVDIYRFTVATGQVVDFDIDTAANGPGGLGSYLRLFNSQGQQLAANNDAVAPGENTLGFDAYLRFTFATSGTYYIAVSNANNIQYDPISGNGDTAGGQNSIGDYKLIVQTAPVPPVDTDDTLGEATLLGTIGTTPQIASASITPDVDVDMYRFAASAGQTIDFDIDTPQNGSGGLGSFIRLFNSQGQQLATNDDAIAPGENVLGFDAYLRFTFATAGTYYLGVSNNINRTYDPTTGDGDVSGGANATGSYTLTVQGLPDDTDDTLSEATALPPLSTTTPAIANAAISPDIDVDLFSFAASAGQAIDFDIDTATNGAGGLGSYLRLFNAQGQQLAFNDDAAAPGENTVGFDAYLRFTFAATGTYYVGVSNNHNTQYNPNTGTGDTAGGTDSIGAYTLNVQLVGTAPADPDDTLLEASSLGAASTTPASVMGNISPDTDVDLYAITVTAGQTVDFDIDTTQNGPGGLGSFLRLFNAQGQQLAANDDAIAPGESVLGFDAYLRFTFAAAGTYYIGVSNNNNAQYDPVTGNGDVAGGANSTGTYQLTVQALPVDTDDSLAEATPLGAVSTTPLVEAASITPDIDVDLYAFTVTAGQVVDFDIDTAQNGPGGLGSYLRLFNAQGQQLAFNNDAAAPGETNVGFDAYLRFTFTTGGTYYIGVSNNINNQYDPVSGNGDTAGGLNSIGSYQLTVQMIAAPPSDPDDTLGEAPSLGAISTTPITRNDSVSVDTDVDLFRFTASAGQTVDFDIDTALNGAGGLNSLLTLFDAQGSRLVANDNAAAPGENTLGFDSYLRFTFTASGTYYLGVSSSGNAQYDPVSGNLDTSGGTTGSYQLIVQALPADPDNTLATANPLGAVSTTGNTVSASITPDIDVDLYSFAVAAGQTVDFDIDTAQNGPGGLGSYLRLFNAQGQQLAFNNDAAAPGESTVGFDAYLRFTFSAAGTYYIGVSNNVNIQYNPVTGSGQTAGGQNSIGAYQLTVQGVPVATPQLSVGISPSAIPEVGGTAAGTVTRSGADTSLPLVVNLSSSSPSDATVPATVTIPANQSSANFPIAAVQNSQHGTTSVTITATATGFPAATQSVLVIDSNSPHAWQNPIDHEDVNNDGAVSALDALIIFNYLNSVGSGPVPSAGNPPPFYDVNGDNAISPLDALLIFNELNNGGSGEGEAAPTPANLSAATPQAPDLSPPAVDLLFATLAPRRRGIQPRAPWNS